MGVINLGRMKSSRIKDPRFSGTREGLHIKPNKTTHRGEQPTRTKRHRGKAIENLTHSAETSSSTRTIYPLMIPRVAKRPSFLDDESVYGDRDSLYGDQVSVTSDPIFQLKAMTNICLDGVNRPLIGVPRLSPLPLAEHDIHCIPSSSPQKSVPAVSATSLFNPQLQQRVTTKKQQQQPQQKPNSCVLLSATAGTTSSCVKIMDLTVLLSPRSGFRQSSSLRSICETSEEDEVSLKAPDR